LLILKRITLHVDVTKTVPSLYPFVFVNVKLKHNCYKIAFVLLYKDESKKYVIILMNLKSKPVQSLYLSVTMVNLKIFAFTIIAIGIVSIQLTNGKTCQSLIRYFKPSKGVLQKVQLNLNVPKATKSWKIDLVFDRPFLKPLDVDNAKIDKCSKDLKNCTIKSRVSILVSNLRVLLLNLTCVFFYFFQLFTRIHYISQFIRFPNSVFSKCPIQSIN
jgi:hypothetical protein